MKIVRGPFIELETNTKVHAIWRRKRVAIYEASTREGSAKRRGLLRWVASRVHTTVNVNCQPICMSADVGACPQCPKDKRSIEFY